MNTMNNIRNFAVLPRKEFLQTQPLERKLSDQELPPTILKEIFENLMNGVLLLTEKVEPIYIDDIARKILRKLAKNRQQTRIKESLIKQSFHRHQESDLDYQDSDPAVIAAPERFIQTSSEFPAGEQSFWSSLIPEEIHHICQSLIDSRSLFPHENWLIESKIFIDPSNAFNIKARWIKLETIDFPCLLLVMEDQHQFVRDIAIEESKKFGLTPREQEVWLLHRANYTYREIASKLQITSNTIKKHMKSIFTKQKNSVRS
ncbi:MAG: helix-turn-helix transcriptional regulator [Leptolyngbyaceae cyanobacterium MO_188.B28]|nr:helix-turn-helix transcriptional regulator [Leptolyngbyaceae cyanobacterium MO_188.B28]